MPPASRLAIHGAPARCAGAPRLSIGPRNTSTTPLARQGETPLTPLPRFVALLALGAAASAQDAATAERIERRVGEAVSRGIDRARLSVRNALEADLGLPRTALAERETWFREGRDGWLRDLAAITREALQRHDTDAPVFHGCCDWHSAVHGHWALMRVMRATGDRQDEAFLRASLTREGLAKEVASLDNDPGFEMPYGRAWFLRMAIEHDDVFHDDTVREAASAVADSLFHYLGKLPRTPYRGEYDNDSWALVQLSAWARHVGDTERLAEIDRWIREDFLASRARLASDDDPRRREFFSRWGNWAYLVARTQPDDALRAWYADHPLGDPDPVWRLGSAHHLGMDWSRAWAIGTLARRLEDPSLRWSYLRHVEAGLEQRGLYAGRYLEYDHWVPQFAVYALTIDLDE